MELALSVTNERRLMRWKFKKELKNTSDCLRHDDGVTKTFALGPQSDIEESRRLDGCWQQDID